MSNNSGHNTRCLEMQQRAKHRIPGQSQLLSKRVDRFSEGVWPGYFSRARGVEVWDLDGNRYIDMSLGGIGANVLGYGDPDVDAAVRQAIELGTSSTLNCPEEVELADLLCELHPWSEKARFARTGGEAMAIAVRIARAYTGRDTVAFCGYHGWHDWYLSANLGGQDRLDGHLQRGLDPAGVPRALVGSAIPFRYNDLQALEQIADDHKGRLGAIVMEPIRNVKPLPGFMEGVNGIAREYGLVLIVDEISAGFRLNTGGAHLIFGLEPDIAVFSKALANGYPMAAVIGRGEVMDAAQKTFISSTNWSERIGPTAAIATVRKHAKAGVAPHLMAIGTAVQNGWRQLAEKHGLPIRVEGIAPMGHYSILWDNELEVRAYFVQLMLQRGFLASNSFYAMYPHTTEHVAAYLKAVDASFKTIAEAAASGQISERLAGRPAVAGFARLN